jgi:hypothetical protein
VEVVAEAMAAVSRLQEILIDWGLIFRTITGSYSGGGGGGYSGGGGYGGGGRY